MIDLGDHEPFDSAIAERFRLLEQIPPPTDVLNRRPLTPPVPVTPSGAVASFPQRPRSPRRLAALAAALALAGGSAIAVTGLGRDSTGVETVDPAGGPQLPSVSSLPVDVAGGSRVVAVEASGVGEVHRPEGSDSRAEAGQDSGTGEPEASGGSDDPSEEGTPPSTEENQTASSTATTSTTDSSSVTSGNDTAAEDTSTTAPVTTTSTTTTTSTSLWTSVNPGKDGMLTIRGTLTEILTDCQSHLRLDSEGQVVEVSPVSCDGGSWIVVDGNRIQTSSGFVSEDQAFDRHDPSLRPGRQVVVVAVSPPGVARLSLDCPVCRVNGG